MFIPHLHFCGDCADAIHLYETAFNTKVKTVEMDRERILKKSDVMVQEIKLRENGRV
jgi:uncharacterized glyoxalase superfamily protein PhnB